MSACARLLENTSANRVSRKSTEASISAEGGSNRDLHFSCFAFECCVLLICWRKRSTLTPNAFYSSPSHRLGGRLGGSSMGVIAFAATF
jgi:hypothetical protein